MLVTKIHNLFHPRVGEIWCLHRVVSQRSWAPSNRELEITPEYLEQLILTYSERGYSFVSLETILSATKQRSLLPEKMVNVSFDDGFIDIFTTAFPIFKRLNVPFTVFLTSGFTDGTACIWWINLERIIDSNDIITLADGTSFITDSQDKKATAYEIICKRLLESDRTPEKAYCHLLSPYIPEIGQTDKKITLSWNQLRQMMDSGLCIVGSHSESHPMLSKVAPDLVKKELAESKARIESVLGKSVRHFSYPHSSYVLSLEEMLSECGYESALLGYGNTLRRGAASYRLNRRYIVQ